MFIILSILFSTQYIAVCDMKNSVYPYQRNNQNMRICKEQCHFSCQIPSQHSHFSVPNHLKFTPIIAQNNAKLTDKMIFNGGKDPDTLDKDRLPNTDVEDSRHEKYDLAGEEEESLIDGSGGCRKAKKERRSKGVHIFFLSFYSLLFFISLCVWLYLEKKRFFINVYIRQVYNMKNCYKFIKEKFKKEKKVHDGEDGGVGDSVIIDIL